MNRIKIISIIIICIILVVAIWSCSNRISGRFDTSYVNAHLIVNDSKYREFTKSIPIYIEIKLSNLQKRRTVDLSNTEMLIPQIKNKKDMLIETEFEIVNSSEEKELLPEKSYSVIFRLKSRLEPGEYKIFLAAPPKLIDGKRDSVSCLKIWPAWFVIHKGKPDKNIVSYYKRRLLYIAEDYDTLQKDLEKLIKEYPDAIGYNIELVDLLKVKGQYKEARQQLLNCYHELHQKQLKTDPDKTPDIPCWIPLQLGELKRLERKK